MIIWLGALIGGAIMLGTCVAVVIACVVVVIDILDRTFR